ncbi:MAG TPA: cytochrome P450 [Polyangiaceae bacterium]|nr:cytochrome P450 [Polyangiaceae bacterium]
MSRSETSPEKPALVFDPDAPAFNVDPYPTFARLREEAPVYYWAPAGSYLVSRYDDVARLLRDPAFSANPVDAGLPAGREDFLAPELRPLVAEGLFRKSAVDHARIRRVVGPAFSPRAVERLRPQVQQLVDEGLAGWAGASEVEFTDFSNVVPYRVMSTMLAIPPRHERLFYGFAQAFVRSIDPRQTPEQLRALFEPVPAGAAMLRGVIDERQRAPGDDLLSALIVARDAGDALSQDELVALVITLISAGTETTTHFLNFALLTFLREPGCLELLRREPALLRGALEEALRWDNFAKLGTPRYATADVELGGHHFRRGDRLLALLPSALRDPRAFADPDAFDPRRQPRESVQFGAGPRYCLGAWLARLEGEVIFATLLARFAHLRLAGEPAFSDHPFMREFRSLRVSLAPPGGAGA